MAAEGNCDLLVLDLQTMKELCQPSLNGRGGPIAPISIQATNFRLKNDMIQQVQNSCQFYGLSGDDANKDLDKFLHVTQSIKVNGVIDDALRLYLFPHSFTHHATAWFDRLPRNSINTFEQMAKMFLGKYFPPSMVTKLRNEITNFRQHTFYNSLTLRHRDTINAAAGGTFMKRRLVLSLLLIENMTAHHNDWNTSAQRNESSSSITSSSNPEIVALKAEMAEINTNLMRVLQPPLAKCRTYMPREPIKDGDDDEEDEGDDGEEGDGYDDDEDDDGEKGNDDDDDQEIERDDDKDDEEEGKDDDQEYDDEYTKETRDEESFDPIPQTPENSNDEGNGEEDIGLNIGGEEGHIKEEEEDELYRDSSSVSSQFVTSMLNLTLDVGMESIFETTSQLDVQTPTSVAPFPITTSTMTPSTIATITTTSQAPILSTTVSSTIIQNLLNFGSLFRFDDRLRSLEVKFYESMQTNQFAGAVIVIPEILHQHIDQRMNKAVKVAVQIQSDRLRDEAQRENDEFLKTAVNEQLEVEVLTRSSHSSRTSYVVAVDLFEMELKKILIEKTEGNKSIQRSDEQRNLYKALDEEPSAGPDWGSKRCREGKEPESANAPTETATRSAGSLYLIRLHSFIIVTLYQL
uniref:Reverse transcriptase domain-containing protein n=1 Tax=Tanacetum cinerariifolium TaxID=118510 RepID=A0A6L2JTJ5_TANCI|nr:reverse transcriptase domain-containing protein [Tanacetum cinerariifolium]